MRSPSTSTHARAFTLIEVLVTLALLGTIAGLGMTGTLRPFHSATIREERDLIVSLLTRARTRAMTNDSGAPHGFCYDAAEKSYEVFKGNYSDENREERGGAAAGIDVTGIPACSSGTEIIFTQLSGTTTAAHINLVSGDASSSIDITAAGAIRW